eukprot:356438_1
MGLDWSKIENTSVSSTIPEAKHVDKGSSNHIDRDRIENNKSSNHREINCDDDRAPSAVPYSRDSRTSRTYLKNKQSVGEEIEIDEELNEQKIRVRRLKKIFAARDRYLIRRQVTEKNRNFVGGNQNAAQISALRSYLKYRVANGHCKCD